MKHLVAAENLAIAYPGGHIALQDVSFALAPGETLGIVGESGSGKTTLIRQLVNLPSSHAAVVAGRILFRDEDVAALSAERWRQLRGGHIAMVFQNPGASLNPMLSVERQFVEAIRNHRNLSRKEARALALEEIARLDLQDPPAILASRPWQLSGGMKQRVAIAIALAMDPELILADEPTAALDMSTQATVMAEFAERRRNRNAAIIVVSHNICACARIADRLMVMRHGRVEDFDTTAAIFSRPADSYAGQLLRAIPQLQADRHGRDRH